MPRPMEPEREFPFVLPGDRDKPERATFWLRSCAARAFREVRQRIRDGQVGEVDAVFEFLQSRLVRWENVVDRRQDPPVERPFTAAGDLDLVIDATEAFQLFHAFELGLEDKKKSA